MQYDLDRSRHNASLCQQEIVAREPSFVQRPRTADRQGSQIQLRLYRVRGRSFLGRIGAARAAQRHHLILGEPARRHAEFALEHRDKCARALIAGLRGRLAHARATGQQA